MLLARTKLSKILQITTIPVLLARTKFIRGPNPAHSCVHIDAVPVVDRSTGFLVIYNTTGGIPFEHKSLPRSAAGRYPCHDN